MRTRLATLALTLALAACQDTTVESEVEPEVVASVVVEPAAVGVVLETMNAYGSVGFAPQQARISDSAAEVIVDEILVSPGQTVNVGDPLIRVHATANSALELSKAQSDLKFAQVAQARISRLREQQLATNAEVDQARQVMENARATLANVHSRVGNGDAGVVRATAAGVVMSVDVARAAIVPPGTPLLHLADGGQVQVRLGIEPADLARLRKGQSVTVSAVYDESLAATGVIDEVVAQIDAQSRVAGAIVNLPKAPGLISGASVRATIELARREGSISVPHSAVLYAGERPYVYVLQGELAHQTWVAVGKDDGTRTAIESGLATGDLVVIAGNYELEEGMRAVATTAPPSAISQ